MPLSPFNLFLCWRSSRTTWSYPKEHARIRKVWPPPTRCWWRWYRAASPSWPSSSSSSSPPGKTWCRDVSDGSTPRSRSRAIVLRLAPVGAVQCRALRPAKSTCLDYGVMFWF